MEGGMKLYVWRDLETLWEATGGVAFAYASSIEEAHALFRGRMTQEYPDEDSYPILEEIERTEPWVYTTPFCDWQQGAG
jgi:hypothetical protein